MFAVKYLLIVCSALCLSAEEQLVCVPASKLPGHTSPHGESQPGHTPSASHSGSGQSQRAPGHSSGQSTKGVSQFSPSASGSRSSSPAAGSSEEILPQIHRNQLEYPTGVPCPTEYIDDTNVKPRANFHVCTKADISNCPSGVQWHSTAPRCQLCRCEGGVAECDKISCDQVPQGTPLPGQGVLDRTYRKRLRRGRLGECAGCVMMARHRLYAFCVCDRPITPQQFYSL